MRGMTPENLERTLRYLPEPDYVAFEVYGFDFSGVFEQAQKIVPEATLGIILNGRKTFELDKPTKEKVLVIYRRFHGKNYATAPELESPGMALDRMHWWPEDGTKVTVTPDKVEATYRGREPEYLTKLREELLGTNVPIEIKAENEQFFEEPKPASGD